MLLLLEAADIIIERKGDNMAVLAKPINRIRVIKKEDSKRFLEEFNKNKISKELLEQCKKAGELFEHHKHR